MRPELLPPVIELVSKEGSIRVRQFFLLVSKEGSIRVRQFFVLVSREGSE